MTLFWQTVQSASFHMGAAVYDVASESPVKPRFERVLELMRAGDRRRPERDMGLRSPDSQTSDLAVALSGTWEELRVHPGIEFNFAVSGTAKQLLPEIHNDITELPGSPWSTHYVIPGRNASN